MKLTLDQINALKTVIDTYYQRERDHYRLVKNDPCFQRHIFDELFVLKQALKEHSHETNIK